MRAAMLSMPRAGVRGFTLLEVLVAIALMAVMTALSWQGVDSLLRAQRHTDERDRQLATLQTALAQWSRDLDAIALVPVLPALDWNGQVLRITRHSASAQGQPPALQVVAWGQRQHQGQVYWARWQSPPLHERNQWLAAWNTAELWGQGQGGGSGQTHYVLPLVRWGLHYALEGRWSNPLSSQQLQGQWQEQQEQQEQEQQERGPNLPAGTGTGSDAGTGTNAYRSLELRHKLPDAIRLQLHLPEASGQLGGQVVRDWLSPTWGNGR